jgi:cyanate permease
MASMLLAHQGGWDEILLALTPLVVVAALLWLANRRANALQAGRAAPGSGEPGPADQGAATATDDPDPPER